MFPDSSSCRRSLLCEAEIRLIEFLPNAIAITHNVPKKLNGLKEETTDSTLCYSVQHTLKIERNGKNIGMYVSRGGSRIFQT